VYNSRKEIKHMESFSFGKEQGRAIGAYGSVGATVVHLMRRAAAFVVTIYLEPYGLLGRHPAAADQLFLVVAGSGRVRAGGAGWEVAPGTAVFWHEGEEHETRAGEEGLVALVIEGDNLAKALNADIQSNRGKT
jgi:quercetin dioxygenase-like cupin family protein